VTNSMSNQDSETSVSAPGDREFDRFILDVAHTAEHNPALRQGQVIWNVASDHFPLYVEPARGVHDLDPFYSDRNITRFLAFIVSQINKEKKAE
jgi:hypothetical protein